MKISTTKQTQGALPELGREEKTMYWLIIGEGEDKYALNVGKKSYEEVNRLIAFNSLAWAESVRSISLP